MAEKPFFVVPLDLGTITTGNERANRPASHLGEFLYRGMVWQSDGNSNLWVCCDLGAAQDIDFVALLGTNAQSGTTIRVRLGDSQGEVDGTADYDSGAVALISPTPATVPAQGYHSHLELAAVSKRWLRIDIGGHSGDFSASMLVVGKKVQPGSYYEGQWQRSVRDLGGVTFSRNGVAGVTAGGKMRAAVWKMSWLTESEMEENFAPMDMAIGKSSPLLACFDPAATSYRQARTYFGICEDQPALTKLGWNRFERQFQILSLF
ncbi:hypothetical protein [Sphingobium chungbukense]|uniref:F5/8 type C domain-containing protein n=1 Tax=Sphingobium chungbukense TaxID=56193 RepID=A0A0M3ARY4_9SPHN|nr:hypothetical protein [Sphingobium chungbukense]KKW92977.1 hypothetical protein YP76_08855 [Sphingobium chungbukense]